MENLEHPRPGLFLRLFLRVPPLFYHLGLANQMAKRGILLLHSTGRRTGRPRVAGLDFARDGQTIYVIAGWRSKTGWYQNLLAKPEAEVQIGDRRVAVRARPVLDAAEQAAACRLLAAIGGGPPKALRPLLSRLGFDFDAEHAKAFARPEALTVMALDEAQRS